MAISHFLSARQASSDYEQSFIIAERYQPTKLLAETGLSDYYWAIDLRTLEANDTQSSVILALIKHSLNQITDFSTTLERVLPEFSRSSGIEPFVSDSGCLSDGRHWFVLPNLKGTPLSEKIKQVGRHGLPVKETLLGAESILQVIRQSPIKESFGYLEPGVILCGENGDYTLLNTPLAVTLKLLTSSHRSAKGRFTLHSSFVSPEVGMGNAPGEKDDVFSLACIVYQMLNGHLPFVLDSSIEAALKETVPATVAKLPTHRWHCLQKGMSFKREERQDNPEALLFQLNNQLEEKPKLNINFIKLAGIACLGAAVYIGYTFYSSQTAGHDSTKSKVLLQLEAEAQKLSVLQKQREAEAQQLAELQQQRELEVQKLAEVQQQRALKESEIKLLAQLQQQQTEEVQQPSQSAIRPPGSVAPRMIQTGSNTRFPNPRLFGPIDPDLRALADSRCRGTGALKAIGYHPQALQLDGTPFPGGAYYCHLPDADPNEESQIGAQPSLTIPRLALKKELAWDNTATFGGVPAHLQNQGNSICRESGFTQATGYHPDALDENGKLIPDGGYLCK